MKHEFKSCFEPNHQPWITSRTKKTLEWPLIERCFIKFKWSLSLTWMRCYEERLRITRGDHLVPLWTLARKMFRKSVAAWHVVQSHTASFIKYTSVFFFNGMCFVVMPAVILGIDKSKAWNFRTYFWRRTTLLMELWNDHEQLAAGTAPICNFRCRDQLVKSTWGTLVIGWILVTCFILYKV